MTGIYTIKQEEKDAAQARLNAAVTALEGLTADQLKKLIEKAGDEIKKLEEKAKKGPMKTKTQKLREDAFGTIKSSKLPCTGGHKPNPDKLNAPLEWEYGVIHVFCEGCGIYFEAGKDFLEEFSKKYGKSPPEPLSGWYVESNMCTICHIKEKTYSLQFKKIPAQETVKMQ